MSSHKHAGLRCSLAMNLSCVLALKFKNQFVGVTATRDAPYQKHYA